MKTLTNLLTSLVLASWVSFIAILSVQNATYVSLRFLGFQSIQLPIGIVLAVSAGVGVVGGAIFPVFWQLSDSRQQLQSDDPDEDY